MSSTRSTGTAERKGMKGTMIEVKRNGPGQGLATQTEMEILGHDAYRRIWGPAQQRKLDALLQRIAVLEVQDHDAPGAKEAPSRISFCAT